MSLPHTLISLGLFLVFLGLVMSGKLGPLGHLPGDIFIQKENFTFFFPLTTMVIVSGIIGLVLWFLRK